ncbi:MAG: hypothetical protein EOR67_03390 [Mesorhizobium sp.]|uniref:hypothetical protein n=2 Tax=Mesorhizobium sp. TaxID=1871066 RepID=UPI000FE7C568|nr:hypothetical protein [Mesorhizobium sp.]RWL83316.1 MAG: hypothetical protein EOR69_11050 [Mesorhizobium sp.]RWL90469.1 MAG: hypothetical protein EOR67_03390 [Mesorhizobium sp.]RWM00057.1 MAG: hypothetical protein EOR70_08620 [Mesorhizobium sp.]TIP02786.1 MAG: hypothetical protein E5X72_19095 [Mesorhizobium sp.]
MMKFAKGAVAVGGRYAVALAAVALVSMVSGCQSMDTMKTGSLSVKPVTEQLGKKTRHVRNGRLHVVNRKPLTRTISVTPVREEAYAAFVRPQPARVPRPVKISYSMGSVGPLLGHSPWICGPSGFGQRSACRAR